MQYIPGNGDQTISGIKPFNEFYFLNCFYSALFPVMIARGSNVINLLVNSPLIYSWEGCTEHRFLSADCCHVQELEAVLLNEGIDVEAYGITNRFTYDLTKALCRGRAVIVNVDCFYEPIRQDCYQTMHWHHSLLAYGLNSETGMVQILEQSRSDVLDYRETSIALEDLSCMYEGYLQHLHKPDKLSFHSFGATASSRPLKDIAAARVQYVRSLQVARPEISEGLSGLRGFIDSYTANCRDEKRLYDTSGIMLPGLNDIIEAKRAQSYLHGVLFEPEDSVQRLQQDILDLWKTIRAIIARYQFSGRYRQASILGAVSSLERVYELELVYYKRFWENGTYAESLNYGGE
ncbi:hypothetical protein [Paenibacillus sp. FSL H3-0333]|uniref:hypothetical protein n=1 Tax=Paenibacillus sp. FSL H3-0333 TaxID=2921373 RepID=UPI0030F75D4A